MTTPLPSATREIQLVTAPEGLPGPEHFAVVAQPLPTPGPGQVLVRNQYFLVFPGLRTLIGGAPEGVPLPPINSGDLPFGPAVGEVVGASGSPLQPGDAVTHLLGWREHALVAAADCTPVGDVLPDPVAHWWLGGSAPPGRRSWGRDQRVKGQAGTASRPLRRWTPRRARPPSASPTWNGTRRGGTGDLPPYLIPDGLDDIVDLLVPELRERGICHTEYTGTTLRENLGLRAPLTHRSAPDRRQAG